MATEKYTNAGHSTLSAGIDNSTTSVPVVDASTFPSSGDFHFRIGTELFKGTSVSANTITVATRPQESSTAASHSQGDAVDEVDTDASHAASLRSDVQALDTLANLPTAAIAGRLFQCSDIDLTFLDSGSSWYIVEPTKKPWNGFFTAPYDLANGTFVNQNSASIVETAPGLWLFTAPADSDNDNNNGLYWTLPSAPWTIKLCIWSNNVNEGGGTGWEAWLSLRRTSDGAHKTLTRDSDNRILVDVWSAHSTFSSNKFSKRYFSGHIATWLKIVDDGVNWTFSFSDDDTNYTTVLTEARNTDITANQFGVGMNAFHSGQTFSTNFLGLKVS